MTDSFNTWLDNLSIFSSNSGVTITICKEQIKNVKIFDFLWTSANTEAQMKWTTDHVPAFFDLLRKYAKDREKGITQSRVFLASDTSIHVSPNPDGPITICPNNHPSADTTTCNTLPPDATADKPKEDVCSSSDDLTDPVEPVAVVTR